MKREILTIMMLLAQEIDRLKAELRLARVREVVRSFVPDSHPSAVGTSGAAGSGHASSRPSGLTNVARLGNYISSLHELDVPITLLSAQSPVPDGTRADEVSETDDEDSETEAAVAERNMDPFAVAVKVRLTSCLIVRISNLYSHITTLVLSCSTCLSSFVEAFT